MMKLYVQQLNIESIMLHERQKKEQKEQLHLADTAEAILSSEPAETLTASIADDISLNIPTPNPQNIPSPTSLNISNPRPQSNTSPPNLELPSQISPNLPPSDLLPPAAARTDQEQGQQRSEQNLNANNLTMSQALELFELLQSRRAADVVRPPKIEAQHVEVRSGRAEPLSFMTIQTVEGIVKNTDIEDHEEDTTWEGRMEKFLTLRDAYSSVNTHTGENVTW